MDAIAKRNLFIGLAVVLVVVALVVGYLWRRNASKTPQERALESAAGGALPAFAPQPSPLGKLQDVNPVSKTNPFKDIFTNPFE